MYTRGTQKNLVKSKNQGRFEDLGCIFSRTSDQRSGSLIGSRYFLEVLCVFCIALCSAHITKKKKKSKTLSKDDTDELHCALHTLQLKSKLQNHTPQNAHQQRSEQNRMQSYNTLFQMFTSQPQTRRYTVSTPCPRPAKNKDRGQDNDTKCQKKVSAKIPLPRETTI